MPIPSRGLRRLAFALGAAAALGGASADAGTYRVEWRGWDLNHFGDADLQPEFVPDPPFAEMSGSFLVTLEPGDTVAETSAGLTHFESNVAVGSELIWSFGEPNLFMGGAEDGIGNFGENDIFLLVHDFFSDDPILAGAGFSFGGEMFAATQGTVSVTELRNPPPAPVPLPASAPLLLGAAAGLMTLRRARTRG